MRLLVEIIRETNEAIVLPPDCWAVQTDKLLRNRLAWVFFPRSTFRLWRMRRRGIVTEELLRTAIQNIGRP